MSLAVRATVAVRELVGFLLRSGDLVRRGGDPAALAAGLEAHALAARSTQHGYEAEVFLRASVPPITIVGRADGVISSPGGLLVEEIKASLTPLEEIQRLREPDPVEALGVGKRTGGDPGGRMLDWAQALCYAAMLVEVRGVSAVGVRLRYVPAAGGEPLLLYRSYGSATQRDYLHELARRYTVWVERAAAWEGLRDGSLASVGFPFPAPRPGQEELIDAVGAAIRHGERLFVQAPTGIGKTMAVLLPAVRGLAEAGLRRVFCLTPRGTTAEAPLQALDRLRLAGARIRSIVLVAREKVCLSRGSGCAPAFCAYARGHHDRILGALEELLREEEIDGTAVRRCARLHTVCPHELALDASEWCDVIVGDYNYAFDPRVHLRRFQDPERRAPAEQVFLVDEAHNLVERAREMYSAELEAAGLEALARAVETRAPVLAGAVRSLAAALPAVAEQCDETSSHRGFAVGTSREPPRVLAPALEEVVAAAGEVLADGALSAEAEETLFSAFSARRVLSRFDERYAVVVEAEPSGLRLRLACLDPSRELAERLEYAGATVFFSATLAPAEYYTRTLAGGDRAAWLALDSPFPRDHLRVVVEVSTSTRFRDRPATVGRVAKVVAEVARAHAGSYLVFVPSFEYLRLLHATFVAAKPQARLLVQQPSMSDAERRGFLAEVSAFGEAAAASPGHGSLVGFAVMGGLFGEGVDLPGEGLAGAVIVGPGLPPPTPERELIRSYYDDLDGRGFAFAYLYPGIGRALQAAGRVIRSETDRGVVVLVDGRFAEPTYGDLLPRSWAPAVARGAKEVGRILREFWEEAGRPQHPA